MANKKGLFGILNDGNGAGVGVDNANPGTTLGSAINNTIASPAFIDNSGVLVFPQLNSDGSIPVSEGGAGVCKKNHAKVTGSTSFQDLGSITGALNKVYSAFQASISAMTECCVQLVHIDDAGGTPTETVHAEMMLGPGQYSYAFDVKCLEIDTTGGTGTQVIKLKAKLLEATGSEIAGLLACKESI